MRLRPDRDRILVDADCARRDVSLKVHIRSDHRALARVARNHSVAADLGQLQALGKHLQALVASTLESERLQTILLGELLVQARAYLRQGLESLANHTPILTRRHPMLPKALRLLPVVLTAVLVGSGIRVAPYSDGGLVPQAVGSRVAADRVVFIVGRLPDEDLLHRRSPRVIGGHKDSCQWSPAHTQAARLHSFSINRANL